MFLVTIFKKKTFFRLLLLLVSIEAHSQSLEFDWTKQIGGNSDDWARKILVDDLKNVYSIGTFEGTVDFDPGTNIFNLTSYGENDIYLLKLDSSGNFVWAKHWGGMDNEFVSWATTDKSGNIYITGSFEDTVDFDPGINEVILSSNFGTGFISKFNPSGEFIWAKKFDGTGSTRVRSIATDDLNNVYTTGKFQSAIVGSGIIDFDPGIDSFNLTATNISSMYISKLDSAGNFVWAKSIEGFHHEGSPECIEVGPSGNVYISGIYDRYIDFDPGIDSFYLPPTSSWDNVFILKLNNSGNFIWAKRFNGPSSNGRAHAMILDDLENIYLTGSFHNSVDFDPGIGTYWLTTANSHTSNIYISKLDSSGSFIWAKKMGAISYCYGSAIALDNANNVYVSGSFWGLTDFDPGPDYFSLGYPIGLQDNFITKLNESGEFIYANSIGGVEDDFISDIITDSKNNIYVTGNFYGTADFNPSTNSIENMSSHGDADGFVLKLKQTIPVSVKEINNLSNVINIFPNPVNKGYTVNINAPSNFSISKFILFDITGRTMLNLSNLDKRYHTINTSFLDKGTYLLQIIFENGTTESQPLIIR